MRVKIFWFPAHAALFLCVTLGLAACGVSPRSSLVQPTGTTPVADPAPDAAGAAVVLLGERHDEPADHRWELAVVRRLYAANPDMILGFEMFPRRCQYVLNEWVAGDLTESAFLKQTDWKHVWGFDPAYYLPVFRFARAHRVPMLALNVSHHLVHLVAQRGWAGVVAADREGVGTPAPASAAYRTTLMQAMGEHGSKMPLAQRAHFIEAQLLWDRAMAEAIAAQRGRRVVALLGKGHIDGLQGVPRQLRALGVKGVVALLPPEGS
jgi:uncharacterized iron-regulated protein